MEHQNKEDKLLLSRVEELADTCRTQYRLTHSEFLDLRQRSLVQSYLRRAGVSEYGFFGGYEDAERVVAVFLPEYAEGRTLEEYFLTEPEDNPLTVLRMAKKKGAPALSHRDYLGAMMGLGIRREVTGDILVRQDGADVIVLRSMAEYLCRNMSQAGRNSLTVAEVSFQELRLPERDARETSASVASLRLDNVLGAAFGLSRSKSLEAVRSGLVFVNGLEILKPDHLVGENDKIVLRHKGRVVLKVIGGKTGKGRTHITLLTYR